MRGATWWKNNNITKTAISTHTPHAGRDAVFLPSVDGFQHFYSHAPCGAQRGYTTRRVVENGISTHTPHVGRDKGKLMLTADEIKFLLTRPMRGATPHR